MTSLEFQRQEKHFSIESSNISQTMNTEIDFYEILHIGKTFEVKGITILSI